MTPKKFFAGTGAGLILFGIALLPTLVFTWLLQSVLLHLFAVTAEFFPLFGFVLLIRGLFRGRGWLWMGDIGK